jgi:hypothetical protein
MGARRGYPGPAPDAEWNGCKAPVGPDALVWAEDYESATRLRDPEPFYLRKRAARHLFRRPLNNVSAMGMVRVTICHDPKTVRVRRGRQEHLRPEGPEENLLGHVIAVVHSALVITDSPFRDVMIGLRHCAISRQEGGRAVRSGTDTSSIR